MVFIWVMRRPWGEPLANVRLDPVARQTADDPSAGAFAKRLHELDEKWRDNGVSELMGRMTEQKADTAALITKHEAKLQPVFEIIESMANLRMEECSILSRAALHYQSDSAKQAFELLRLDATAKLLHGKVAAALEQFQTLEKLAVRLLHADLAREDRGEKRPFLSACLPLAEQLAEQLSDAASLSELEACLTRFANDGRDTAEMARRFLFRITAVEPPEEPEPGFKRSHEESFVCYVEVYRPAIWLWALGSDANSTKQNFRVLFSEIIDQMQRDPEFTNFTSLGSAYLGAPGSFKRENHFGSSYYIRWEADYILKMYEEQALKDQAVLKKCREIQARVAAKRMKTIGG